MWMTLEEYERKQNEEFCKKQYNEAFEEARDVLIDYDLYNEGFGGKILEKIKSGLQKVCPSPDKLKDFMSKYAKKIDDKLKNCKEKWFVDAWNSLKQLAQNMDNKQANESFALYLESIGENLNEEAHYDYIEKSLYEEGLWDKLKNGVKAGVDAFKNTGNNDQGNKEQSKPEQKQDANKSSSTKKPSKLGQMIQQNGWSQEDALNPENVKKIASALKKSGKSVPDMVKKYFANNPQQDKKKDDKKTNGKQGEEKKSSGKVNGKAILQFLKKHWKMIAIILIAAIGFMYGGPLVGAKFLVGPTIREACKLIGGKGGALVGTIAGAGAAMAMGGLDGDVDVDAGDVDSGDANVDDGDYDGDGDHDADDLIGQRGNKEWVQNLSDEDKNAISKTFTDDPKMIAANGMAGMDHGGDHMLVSTNGDGGFTANVENIEYVNVDSSGNLVDTNGKPLDLDQEMKRIADSDPQHGVFKAKLFANGFHGLQKAIKSGAAQALKGMH